MKSKISIVSAGRLDHIDGLRAFAALYVVLHHIVFYVYDDLPLGPVKKFCNFIAFGHYAVDLFIVLSGFCLMLPVIRNSGKISGGALNFFRKRAWRILPPYFSVLIVSLLLIWFLIGTGTGTVWNYSLPVTPAALLTHFFLIHDLFPATSHRINYCLWSISVEWRIYFFFPLLVYGWSRFGALITAAATTIFSFLLLIPLQYTCLDTSVSGMCVHYYGLFTIGMLAAALGHSHNRRLVWLRSHIPWSVTFVLMASLAIFFNKGYYYQIRLPWQVQDLFVALATMSLLVAVTPSPTSDRWHWVRKALGWKPLAFVGTFSYSLYLLHSPVLQVIWVYFVHPLQLPPSRSLLLLATAGFASIMCAAYLFFLIFERPFISSRKARPGVSPLPEPLPEPAVAAVGL